MPDDKKDETKAPPPPEVLTPSKVLTPTEVLKRPTASSTNAGSEGGAVQGPQYLYQRKGQEIDDVRPKDLALNDARALLLRLHVDDNWIDAALGKKLEDAPTQPNLRRLLLRWAIDVPLNIQWYETRLGRSRWLQTAGVVVVLVVGVAALAFTANSHLFGNSTAASVGLIVAFLMTLLQIVALLTDRRARIAAFWRASADLQERLLTFEDRWVDKPICERVSEKLERVSAEFVIAVLEETQKARLIAREERNTFFSTLISPGDLLTIAQQGIGAVRARRAELDDAQKRDAQLAKARSEEAGKQQTQLAAAEATFEARQTVLDGLLKAGADAQKVAQARIDLEAARMERERLRRSLGNLFVGFGDR